MGKIIKKEVKRSLPILVILSVVSFLVVGFSFNLDFNLVKFNQKDAFLGITPEAQADTASTSVTVQNEGPAFTAVAESPASTSTSPINVGYGITFIATGTDQGGDAYWLIVCESDGVATVTAGNPPTCLTGSTFCVSSATSSSGSGSTCASSTISDPGVETDEWYAYICDDHSSEPQCSDSSQGSGDSGSPMHINHAPQFTLATTTDNNKDPGGTFTFQASTTDTDVMGSQDEIYGYFCTTDSWSVAAGCASTTLCIATSTDGGAASCNYTDTAPTPDQDYTYYAFVKDWHDFAANSSSSQNATYTINNVAPSVTNVTLNSGADINLNLRLATEVEVAATSTSITDNNGCADISSATSTIYLGTVTNGHNCSADDSDCYQIASGNCTISGCDGDNDSQVTYTCTTTFAFYAISTDDDHVAASTTGWMARITVTDDDSAFSSDSFIATSVDVVSTAGVDVYEAAISYGNVQAGSDTGQNNSTTTVINYGNTPIDTDVSGTDMDDGGTNYIDENRQEYSLTIFDYDAGSDLSSTTPATVNVVIPRPTSQATTSDDIYWGIGILVGTPSGDYSGVNTLAVVEDADGNWNYP